MPPELIPVKPMTATSDEPVLVRKEPYGAASQTNVADSFLADAGRLIRRIQNVPQQIVQVVSDPRTVSLARISAENPALAALIIRVGISSDGFNIQNLSRDKLNLIVNNIGLLQQSGFLNAVRDDIHDPRLDAFLRLRERNSELADSLARLFVRATTTSNFGINDITTSEILLIANNKELLKETGFLDAVRNDLPAPVRQAMEFPDNHPVLFNTSLWLGNNLPFLVDFGKRVADNPVRGYVAIGTTAVGAIGFGVLCFFKFSLITAFATCLPAAIIGGLLGFGLGLLLSKLF